MQAPEDEAEDMDMEMDVDEDPPLPAALPAAPAPPAPPRPAGPAYGNLRLDVRPLSKLHALTCCATQISTRRSMSEVTTGRHTRYETIRLNL